MLITSSIPNLINGVSQQPATLRLASQAEGQVNFLSSVAEGLTKRPGSRHLAKLSNDAWADGFIHTINRDTDERYLVVIRNGTLQVFEADTGVERTVNAPDGLGYLTSAAKKDFRAVTVADYTFILNRNRQVLTSANLSPAPERQALLSVVAGNYARRYRVFINDVMYAEHLTPRGDVPDQYESVGTDFIATAIFNQLVGSAANANFAFIRTGSRIRVVSRTSTKFKIRVEDEAAGVNFKCLEGTVQRFSDLPTVASNGFTVEVIGDQSSSFDNYHVKYTVKTEESEDSGVWKESLLEGEKYQLNAVTMPHILVRESDGTFTFKKATWEDRKVGDLNKMPMPSFVDQQIRDVFFFQNRLGLIADENVVLSNEGDFFNFFRGTATSLLDSDPIDVAVSSDKVSLLNYAVPFNKSLLLFSDQSQFVLEGGDILTPQTASIAQATSFESLQTVRPVGVGQYVYFPVPRGSSTALREYFVQQGNSQNDALDVTSHVPQYLPKGISAMSASSSEDTLVALSDNTPNSIWVYRFFFNQEGKLQSAWSEWRFSTEDTILSVEFIDGRMYTVVSRSDGTFLEYISLESGFEDLNTSISFRVDRGAASEICTMAYDATDDITTITLPFETDEPLYVIARGDNTLFGEGYLAPVADRPARSSIRVLGDWSGGKFIIGQPYLSSYTFSTFYLRDAEGGGGVSTNADGRLQLRYLSVDYSKAGYFRLVSEPRNRNRTEKVFSGRVLGVQSGKLGTFALADGRFRIPIMSRNTDANIMIETDSFLPASFTAAEWEASFTTRSRKV